MYISGKKKKSFQKGGGVLWLRKLNFIGRTYFSGQQYFTGLFICWLNCGLKMQLLQFILIMAIIEPMFVGAGLGLCLIIYSFNNKEEKSHGTFN